MLRLSTTTFDLNPSNPSNCLTIRTIANKVATDVVGNRRKPILICNYSKIDFLLFYFACVGKMSATTAIVLSTDGENLENRVKTFSRNEEPQELRRFFRFFLPDKEIHDMIRGFILFVVKQTNYERRENCLIKNWRVNKLGKAARKFCLVSFRRESSYYC